MSDSSTSSAAPETLLKTPLHDLHVELGARMVPFAGYSMPVQYPAGLMAERFREALRNARDRETMLTASREMLEEIEKIAGHERADSLSERIATLLPQHLAA